MGTVNRFSKAVRPAEFNPMTADDIMRVPLLKGQMEQEQLQAIEDKRLEMMNVDVAPGDMERVRAEQARVSGQFDELVGQITSEGVSHRSTDAVNKFMRDYNESTSKSGIIGNAAQFAADRKERREQDRQLAIQRGYNMQDWEKLYSAHEAGQQSVDAEGNLVSEFQNINLPMHLDPKKTFRDAIKGKIGKIKEGTTLGDYKSTNRAALVAAVDQILSEYENNPQYRQTLQDLGYDKERLAIELSNEADIVLDESFVKYQQAPLTEKQKAAKAAEDKKTREEADRLANLQGQRVLAEFTGEIEAADIRQTGEQLGELESAMAEAEKSGTVQDQDNARLNYLQAIAKNDEVEKAFNEQGTGKQWAANRDAARNDLISSAVPVGIFDTEAQAQAYIESQGHTRNKMAPLPSGFVPYNPKKFKSGEKVLEARHTPVQGADGKIRVYERGHPVLEKYNDAIAKYDEEFDKFAGPNMLHASRTWYAPMSKSTGGSSAEKTNTAIRQKIAGDLKDIASGRSGDVQVGNSSSSYVENGQIKYIEKDPTKDAENADYIKRQLSLGQEFTDIKFALPTDTRPGAIKVTFNTKEVVDGKERDVQHVVELNMSGGKSSEWGIFLSEGLMGKKNDQLSAMVDKHLDQQKYQNIFVMPEPRETTRYANTKEIKQVIREGVIGGDLAYNTEGLNLFYGDNGKVGIRGKYKNGVERTLSKSDVYATYSGDPGIIADKNLPLWKHLKKGFYEKKGLPLDSPSTKLDEYEAEFLTYMTEQMGSRDPFTTESKSKLMKILEQNATTKK